MLQPLAKQNPLLIGGSADLYGSTLNYIGDLKARDDDFSPGQSQEGATFRTAFANTACARS